MKFKIISMIIIIFCICIQAAAQDKGICSLNINTILDVYEGTIEKLIELVPSKNKESLSENRIKINFLNRHITALKAQSDADISDYLQDIYRDSIIRLYEELDSLQSNIIAENVNSTNELSVYLTRIKNKKTDQDETLDDINERVSKLRSVIAELSDTFDSYDQIIEKQNGLIESALELKPEAYKNTFFLLPGLAAGHNLTPYISLGLGYMTSEGWFSYGGIIEAGYSPNEELVNVGVAMIMGFNWGD